MSWFSYLFRISLGDIFKKSVKRRGIQKKKYIKEGVGGCL